VVQSDGEYGLIVAQSVGPGAYLFDIDGTVTASPSRFTVQIDRALHVDRPGEDSSDARLDRYYWRFMNHSCEPTAVIRGRRVLSLKTLEPGQEITFHYNTTEYEMVEPFDCRCGSRRCEGRIRGFRFVSAAQRQRMRPHLAAHLASYLHNPAAETAGRMEPAVRLQTGTPQCR
jgi:hypothetical protein